MAITEDNVERIVPRRRGCSCFTCAAIFAIFSTLLFFWLMWNLAATGLVEVPLMTPVAFNKPKPDHVVNSSVESVESWFLGETFSILHKSSLTIPESVLTRSLREANFSAGKQLPLDLKNGQVAVVDQTLEVFAPIAGTETAVIISVAPFVSDDGIGLDIKSVKIGSMKIPFFAKFVLNRAVKLGIDKANNMIGQFAEISDIKISEVGLVISGSISDEAIKELGL
jgi:hypothetical protein